MFTAATKKNEKYLNHKCALKRNSKLISFIKELTEGLSPRVVFLHSRQMTVGIISHQVYHTEPVYFEQFLRGQLEKQYR